MYRSIRWKKGKDIPNWRRRICCVCHDEKRTGKSIDSLSVSIGYVLAEEYEGLSVRELVEEADKAMYEQKKLIIRLMGTIADYNLKFWFCRRQIDAH